MVFPPHFVLLSLGGGRCGGGGGGGPVGEPRLTAPLLPHADHAGVVGPLRAEEEIVITVTEASDDEIEDVGWRVHDRIECRFDPEASEMSSRIAAITRSRATSREATPTHSRSVSRVPSCEELDEGSVIINPVQEALHSHSLSTSQNPTCRPRRNPCHRWGGSSSNLTSTDSTPSSDTAESGQATYSPLTGNINSLGFPPTAGDASPCQYRVPIVGYEVLEERARFTVFKIQVFHQPTGEHWFVFRRYTDFVRLNKALKMEFPGLRFALPPKRWFGDNFDPIFLEDRQLGLQAFIDNIVGYSAIREKKCVRDFFCLDDPLGTHDTLEESRAMCQNLEETVSDLQDRLREKEGELAVLRSQVNFLLVQQQTLVKALRLECDLKSPVAPERGSTHDLNLALLNICERTLDGSFINGSHGATGRSGANGTSGETSPVRRGRVHSTVESPLRRTLEKAFLPRSCSHNTLSLGHNGATSVNGTRPAKALIVTAGEDGASR